MSSSGLLWAVLVLVPVCVLLGSAGDVTTIGTTGLRPTGTNSSRLNSTQPGAGGSIPGLRGMQADSSMIQRALYVLIGFTMLGVLYFLIRAVRLKRPAYKKKYGLLSNYDDSVEMEAVESEEDDTLYEARSLRR